MFRIAFTIGLILTSFSLNVTASPQPQEADNKKKADDNYIKTAKQIITRYDTNNDKKLGQQEWQKMLLSPEKADANQDQQITVDEYAKWARSKDRSGKVQATPPTQPEPKETPQMQAQNKNNKTQPTNDGGEILASRDQLASQRNQDRAKQAQEKAQQERREQELVEQIEGQLAQRERREMEERERRDIEQQEREERGQRDIEQREREERGRRDFEQREREERGRRDMEQNRQREMQDHPPRDKNEHWENDFRRLEETRALLNREHEEVSRKFGDDHPRRLAIERELNEIEGVMKRIFHERGDHEHGNHDRGDHDHRNHDHGNQDRGEHNDGDRRNHDRDPHEQGDHEHHRENEMPTAQRLELLRVAYDHLQEAGMHDLAEATKRRGVELEQQLRQDNGHDNGQIQRLIEESHRAIHAVNQRLDQVQRELQEMREQFDRLRNER